MNLFLLNPLNPIVDRPIFPPTSKNDLFSLLENKSFNA